MVSSNVLSQPRPDLPAKFASLNDDTKRLILQFVGNKSYAIYAGISKHCKEIYITTNGMTKKTFLYGYGPLSVIKDIIERFTAHYRRKRNNSPRHQIPFSKQREFHAVGKGVVCYNRRDVLKWALQGRKKCVLKGICYVSAGEERFDILEEMWNNIDDGDYRSGIFESFDAHAARFGKLNVLKWLETKGLDINKTWCAHQAARYGQLHILQWLQEERGLKLERYLFLQAIYGGHLHVMKWLKEQEVPWGEYTLKMAAKEGNLDILQWLHNEGFPWPDNDPRYRVNEDRLKPEVQDWLHTNGYADRIAR